MKLFKPLLFQLYLLQLENYNLKRFVRLATSKLSSDPFGDKQRQGVVWTMKAWSVLVLSIILSLLSAFWITHGFTNVLAHAISFAAWFFVLLNWLAALFLSLSVLLLWPLDFLVKQIIVSRAKAKLAAFKNLKIIAITGSFGKTTMKECLTQVLSEKYRVLKTPENQNTPLGISRLILNKLDSSAQILIVEMGAYRIGDIAELCLLTPPDVSILTGINEAHLELFGSIENTIQAKFEVVKYSKPGAAAVLNENDKLIKENYQKYTENRKVSWYGNSGEIPLGVKVNLLGSFIPATLSACVIIAKELLLSDAEIKAGIGKIQPIPHRLQLIENSNGVTVIDDSYNGNPAGVTEAIKVLGSFQDKRKIYITPGLVEMGEEARKIHERIGEQLAGAADLVILIKNSVTPFIADGLRSRGFNSENIIWFERATEAHANLGKIIKAGDVVMFQNDWPDNYL